LHALGHRKKVRKAIEGHRTSDTIAPLRSPDSYTPRFMSQRRAEWRHDAVAHHLVDGALIVIHAFHYAFEHRIEDLARVLPSVEDCRPPIVAK